MMADILYNLAKLLMVHHLMYLVRHLMSMVHSLMTMIHLCLLGFRDLYISLLTKNALEQYTRQKQQQ